MSKGRSLFQASLGAALALWGLASCAGPQGEAAQAVAAAPEAGELQQQVPGQAIAVNDRARFLAGLPANPASPYAALQRSLGSGYESHGDDLWQEWRSFSSYRLQPSREWAAQYLGAVGGTVFYPFGGPDVINALALFPQARQIILVGLEPVGGFAQDPTQLLPGANLDALARFRKGTDTLLDASYFITEDMKVDFSQPPFVGVSPVMQGLLALGGYQVLQAQETRLGGVPAVQVQVSRLGTGTVQQVVYLQGDLSDGGPSGMLDWVRSQGPRAVYLKAASYLLHEGSFGRIRRFVLDVPGPIVQDDSGVPFAALRGAGRRVQLFGEYQGTLDIFRKYYQADLAAAYQQVQAPKLNFSTGYSVRFDRSNLQLAWPRGGGPGAVAQAPNLAPAPVAVAPGRDLLGPTTAGGFSAAPARPAVEPGYAPTNTHLPVFEPEPAW